jgi:hypothetical protein
MYTELHAPYVRRFFYHRAKRARRDTEPSLPGWMRIFYHGGTKDTEGHRATPLSPDGCGFFTTETLRALRPFDSAQGPPFGSPSAE